MKRYKRIIVVLFLIIFIIIISNLGQAILSNDKFQKDNRTHIKIATKQ